VEVATTAAKQALDITSKVAKVVSDSSVRSGLALIFTMHTTTGLFVNERESGLQADVESALSKLVPANSGYLHDRVDDNAASHIQSVLLGPSLVVPVTDGRLDLGTWQSLFLAERDGPRQRTLVIKVIGENR